MPFLRVASPNAVWVCACVCLCQGATCYLNSLLQTLFHTRLFRRVVYEVPTDGGATDSNRNVVLALQRLFLDLQRHHGRAHTTMLTNAFGWRGAEVFTQHDVQEMNRVLCDHLSESLAGTALDGCIDLLLAGATVTTTKCVNVDFRSAPRMETFFDVQLDVKVRWLRRGVGSWHSGSRCVRLARQGFRSVEESLNKFIAPEMLSGDNQYQTDDYGKQVRKRASFSSVAVHI